MIQMNLWFCSFIVYLCVFARRLFSCSHFDRCQPCFAVSGVNIHDYCLCMSLSTVCTVWMCVCVYIWLYVGRWQGFVFTTSVLAVCACGFLHFTAASSTQPHRSCVFSLFHSVIVSIIKAVFAGRILSRQRITGSLNCWNGPARGSCV